MVNKRKLHHWLHVVRQLKVWQLIVLLVIMSFVSAYLLRQNNLGMVERRDFVKQTDEEAGDVQTALLDLQKYVSRHMNTDLGERGVYLEHAYQRAYDRALQEATQTSAANSAAYQKAEGECRGRFPGSTQLYVQCVAQNLQASGSPQNPLESLKAPNVDLYRYNFVSPFWTPDLAGLSVLVTVLLLLIIVARIAFAQAVRLVLKHRAR